MTKKKIYKVVLLLAIYAVAFGVLLPWLISAKSTLAFILGLIILVAFVVIPTVNITYSLFKNENS